MKSIPLSTCDSSIARTPKPLVLYDVLKRFQAEAVWDTLDMGRYKCRYFSWGEGPPLLFIHGLADDAASFVMPMAKLSRHFRCIAYHLPTGWNDNANLFAYRHDDLVADCFALLDHLQLDRTYVYGSSFGSTIGLKAMHAQPERFPRAVLQGAFAQRCLSFAERILCSLGRFSPWSMQYFPFRKATLKHEYGTAFKNRDPAVWNYFVERTGALPMAALAQRGLMLVDLDLRRLLPNIPQPILMICGQHDPLVNRDCEETLLEGLPNALRIELQNCGHHPYFTHPEVLAEAMHQFLTPAPCQQMCG